MRLAIFRGVKAIKQIHAAKNMEYGGFSLPI